ncbi:MAG: ATP-dependent Clp protease proteolytic subunit, partial [Cyanobacteria bacterium J06629_19]
MSVDRILRVPYNVPGSQNWQWVSVYTRMSQERILFLNQPLTDGVANSIVSALLYLDSEYALGSCGCTRLPTASFGCRVRCRA